MSCDNIPKLNFAEIPCREIPNGWTLNDAIQIKAKYSGSYQFGTEFMRIIMHVKTRLPRKVKKKIKKTGILILKE